MHTPAMALPGATSLLNDPAAQAIAAQVFGRRAQTAFPGSVAPSGVATLVAGAAVVATAAIGAASLVLLSGQNSSGVAGELTVSARVAGVSFTITSTSATDTRDVGWLIVAP